MSHIALGLNLFLVVMLAAALGLGWRLNRRLKALRDSHDSFAKAVQELNAAAQRAEQGLADLRAATDEANEALAERIEKARVLAERLDGIAEKPAIAAREPAPRERADVRALESSRAEARAERLGALLAGAHSPRPRSQSRIDDLVRRAPPPARNRAPRIDDDLFDEPLELGPLNAVRGGR